MTLVASIDGTTSPRRIYLHVDTVGASVHPIDIYKEMRTLRSSDETLREFDVFMSAFGNVSKGGGKFTERYVRLNDCVIVPYDTSHILTITGTLINDSGQEGILVFDKSPLSATTSVDIAYVPPQVEVIEVSSGSGLDAAQDAKLSDIHGQTSRSVYVDTELVTNGNGYQQSPYNNWTSAVDYAEANGLKKLTALADAVVDRQLKNFEVSGVGVPSIDLNGQIMDGSIFERCKLTGSYTGTIQATECAVVNLSGMQGVFLTVSAAGTLSPLPGGSLLISRVAPAISAQAWTLNMNSGVASIVAVHNSSGEVIVTNMDHAGDTFHFHATNGELIIDSTCTAGNIVVSGTVKVIDNSAGATVNISAVSSEITLDAIA